MSPPSWLPQVRLPAPPDDLLWIALTVAMEAAAEPWDGKLGVAHVIVTRARRRGRSIPDVVLEAWQFSAWNTESPTRGRLDAIPPAVWGECHAAACAAVYGLAPDPTQGAESYLNVALTRQSRRDGRLPPWAADPADPTQVDARRVTAVIGAHTFLRVG